MSRGVILAVKSQVNVGDSFLWSSTSGSVCPGLVLTVRGWIKFGDSVPRSATSGPVSPGEAGPTLVLVSTGTHLDDQCPLGWFGSLRAGQR